MLIIKHTVITTASPKTIWGIWEDVSNWNSWDHGIESSSINGPFAKGTTGALKPEGGPQLRIQLTCVEPIKRFISESKLPLTQIIVIHSLSESEGKTFVTHQIEMTGILAPLFALIIDQKMKKNLPEEMKAMIKMAESLRQ